MEKTPRYLEVLDTREEAMEHVQKEKDRQEQEEMLQQIELLQLQVSSPNMQHCSLHIRLKQKIGTVLLIIFFVKHCGDLKSTEKVPP